MRAVPGRSRHKNTTRGQDGSVNSGNSTIEAGGDSGIQASRYDPKAMSRIVDITDLVDESSDNEDSDDETPGLGGGEFIWEHLDFA